MTNKLFVSQLRLATGGRFVGAVVLISILPPSRALFTESSFFLKYFRVLTKVLTVVNVCVIIGFVEVTVSHHQRSRETF